MIGGSDIVLWVDENAPAADLIMRIVRQYWPKFVVQNAEDDQPLDVAKSSAPPQTAGQEFFLYRTAEAAQDWLQSGATDKNKNTMLHVILGKRRKPELQLRSITLVGDEWSGEMATILAAIQVAFDAFTNKKSSNGTTAAVRSLPQSAERE